MIKIIFICLIISLIGYTLIPKNLQEYEKPIYNSSLRDFAQKKELLIGTCVTYEPLIMEEKYGKLITKEYNVITMDASQKFEIIHPKKGVYDFSEADEIINFAEANDMKVRGHTLVWHRQLPNWLLETKWTKNELIEILRDHIHTVVGRYKGRIYTWDVVNEAQSDIYGLRNSIWKKIIGPEYIDLAFRFAREADPDVLLFYNDYMAENMGRKSNKVYDLVKNMIKNNVPINGVGLQSHYLISFVEPKMDEVKANMERLINLGLEVHITEMDVSILSIWPFKVTPKNLRRQAEIYSNMLELCLSIDKCNTFIIWGLTDKYSWIPQESHGCFRSGLIFNPNYQPKPAYDSMYNLLKERQ